MVSNMSLTSWRSGSSKVSTGLARWRSTGSPYLRTGRTDISAALSLLALVTAQDLHDRALGELHFHLVGDAQHGLRLVHADHGADDPSGRHHAVALLQLLQHLVELLLALL